jgi:hypothetical protein
MFESTQVSVLWHWEHASECDRREAAARASEAVRALAGAVRAGVRMIQLGDRVPARDPLCCGELR